MENSKLKNDALLTAVHDYRVAIILRLRKNNVSWAIIADVFQVSTHRIHNILRLYNGGELPDPAIADGLTELPNPAIVEPGC